MDPGRLRLLPQPRSGRTFRAAEIASSAGGDLGTACALQGEWLRLRVCSASRWVRREPNLRWAIVGGRRRGAPEVATTAKETAATAEPHRLPETEVEVATAVLHRRLRVASQRSCTLAT